MPFFFRDLPKLDNIMQTQYELSTRHVMTRTEFLAAPWGVIRGQNSRMVDRINRAAEAGMA